MRSLHDHRLMGSQPIGTAATTSAASATESEDHLPLGLPTLVLLVIASMIGIGCFVSSGFAIGSLGNPARVILAWVLCGGWAIVGAIGYGALARRVPLSGGEYLFLSRLIHPSVGFLAVGFLWWLVLQCQLRPWPRRPSSTPCPQFKIPLKPLGARPPLLL